MTKVQIYIDFEAISSPFNRDLNLQMDYPYAYTIGGYTNGEFKTKTFIVNFSKNNLEDIYSLMRIKLSKNIREIIKKKDFLVNSKTIEFIAWGGVLERKLLAKIFKGVQVKELNPYVEISIDRMSKNLLYFNF